jgi:hypothetical protein
VITREELRRPNLTKFFKVFNLKVSLDDGKTAGSAGLFNRLNDFEKSELSD